MKNIGICVNLQKDSDFSVTKNIIKIIEELGRKCEVVSDDKEYDFIISLGGDGTFLATSRRFYNIPIVGVNLGHLGFLSEIDKDEIKSELKKLIDGNFYIEERFFIESKVLGRELCALNDIVISKGNFSKLLNFELYFDNKFVDNYAADGIIISTPTGSTAYSLSAGGPIVEPKLDVLVVTPICAHSLHQRPIIIDSKTEIKLLTDINNFMIIADGQDAVESENIREVIIKRSDKKLKIIKTTENCFFDIVRKKFHKK